MAAGGERFPAAGDGGPHLPKEMCWDLRSGILWRGCQGLSSPHTVIPPPLLFHVGINNTARGDPGHTKCDFVALDAMAIGMGAKWSSASEVKVLEGKQMQPGGQQLVVQLVSIGIQFL